MKKAQAQSFNSSRFDALIILNKKLKSLVDHIANILLSSVLFREITKILSEGNTLGIDEKDKINKFVNDQKSNNYDS